jgi:hypothetical protein
MSLKAVVIGLKIGVLITPVAAILAIISGGVGHGHYGFARLLFPYTMLLTLIADDTITVLLRILALIQFPIYGALIGWFAPGRMAWAIGAILFAAHAVAAAICFSGVIPNFS